MGRPEPWYRVIEGLLIPSLRVWFRWRFEGLGHVPAEGPALVACNHISYFDPLAQGLFIETAGRRPRYLTKSELYKNPLMRSVLRGARQIPVRRGSGEHAPVEAALSALRHGQVVMVYPEATVTTQPDFSPMKGKTGIARLALGARLPVIPLAVWGSQQVWQRGSRSLKKGRPIWVKAGAPLDFSVHEEEPNHPEVLRMVTGKVMAELGVLVDDLRARYPKEWQ